MFGAVNSALETMPAARPAAAARGRCIAGAASGSTSAGSQSVVV
jgi:hypothetical protein